MALVLEITVSPSPSLIGKKFAIRPGLSIGRKRGEVLINDSKVSSLHASVEAEPNGDYVLRDQNSSNGTWVNGKQVDKVLLVSGSTFQIGDYHFQVLEFSDEEIESMGLELLDWRKGLNQILRGLDYSKSEGKLSFHLKPFAQALRLTFTHGPFLDQFITFGFGPRRVGYNQIDEEILDPQLPQEIFEIIPHNNSAEIRNICGSQLFLNNKNFESEILKEGDVIRISTHQLKVSFIA